MNIEATQHAIDEAKRFIAAAELAQRSLASKANYEPNRGVLCAAAKRASMDLTRALARMRRP